ncbi:MAG: hypothetical protein ACOY3P_20245 [Planctomycetota bacterium]
MNYYHAGVKSGDDYMWSAITRRTREAAEREARAMARKSGGEPMVEWWDRSHGLRPGDCEAVLGCAEVAD